MRCVSLAIPSPLVRFAFQRVAATLCHQEKHLLEFRANHKESLALLGVRPRTRLLGRLDVLSSRLAMQLGKGDGKTIPHPLGGKNEPVVLKKLEDVAVVCGLDLAQA